MDGFADAWQMLLRLDVLLDQATAHLGAWTYAAIFLTVFVETGFVVTGILPSGTLLFAAAALAARGNLAFWPLLAGGTAAAFCGDQLNFAWGVLARRSLAGRGLPRAVKAAQLDAARRAFDKYGPMTIVLARFVPMLRSVAPLAAGLAGMPGRTFAAYNLCGKLPWTALHVCGGYFLGRIPWFAKHFTAVLLAAALFPFAIAVARTLVLRLAAKRPGR
ncbi:DedA family protein [Solidesulfovibrio sp.]|uniref:DedA family protein n=1 Tax=Solidesulfovibrio sp. TaxID=2910990 RepID=UPI002B20BF14|nr:DedA family protein [Solidesulfovibrio sp.]MEA4856418.1 DedA family protein [Solidesulfovibrio sp.]